MILRRPGETVRLVLSSERELDIPEDQKAAVVVRIPSEGEYRAISRAQYDLARDRCSPLDVIRVRFGVFVVSVENVRITCEVTGVVDATEPLVVERDPQGRVTEACIAKMRPLVDDISEAIDECSKLTRSDRKNS